MLYGTRNYVVVLLKLLLVVVVALMAGLLTSMLVLSLAVVVVFGRLYRLSCSCVCGSVMVVDVAGVSC